MTENRGYMQRYAMLFGTYMGGFWILKFILFPVGLSVPFFIYIHFTSIFHNMTVETSISRGFIFNYI